ncbi:GNAT family N-acetyltransferase [Psychrobacter sp.]|uniref:GNAT family N-acetyltransferase n=1 Tax=Psychrobacter sp. TaxID=56811 RepID=UPI0025EDC019|nr:GNAT family N-acetyltransferase [Psychrobacter sp.]
MTVKFTIKNFDELTNVDVYYILQARSQVFVVEQHCAYQDIDEIDFDCLHLVAHMDKTLVGYCRIIPPNIGGVAANPNPRIGRVLVLPEYRRNGLARDIMIHAIKHCRSKYGKKPIKIAAQTYLLAFYQSLGFESISEPYEQDGLEHIDMVLQQGIKKAKSPAMPAISKGISTKTLLMNLVFFIIAVAIVGLLYLLI